MTVAAGLTAAAWKNRKTEGASWFLSVMILLGVWITAQALEFCAENLGVKIFWANIQYLPIAFTPVLYLAMVFVYTGREHYLKKKYFLFYFSVPVIINLLIWTNSYHELLRQNIFLDKSGYFLVVGKTFGPLFWVFAFYNYLIIFICLILLADTLRHRKGIYYYQSICLFTGLLLPVITTSLHLTDVLNLGFDLTPPVFGLSGLVIGWGIFRHSLFNIMPVARSVIIEKMESCVLVFDCMDRLVDINPAGISLFKIQENSFIGTPAEKILKDFPDLLKLLKEDITAIDELEVRDKKITRYFEISSTAVANSSGRKIGTLLMLHNITRRKKAEEMIRYMAFHDYLTGLPNRKLFMELFAREITAAKRNKTMILVLFIDLDDLKHINDSYGHIAGDCYIREAASLLKSSLRESDIVSRLGGDEFALLLPGVLNNDDIENLVNKTFMLFDRQIEIDDNILRVRASIGVSIYPSDGTEIDDLIKKADSAMYKAKKKGKNCIHLYSSP